MAMGNRRRTEEPNLPGEVRLWPLVRSLLAAVGLLGLCVYFLARGGRRVRDLPAPSRLVDVSLVSGDRGAVCGPPSADGRPVVVDMLYSDDKRAWLEDAANRFSRLCPNIQVMLSPMGDIESADAILDGDVKPTLWSPADDLILRYMADHWKERRGASPFDLDKQTSIARSPLVILIWEDRSAVVRAILASRRGVEGAESPWADTLCAGVPRLPEGLDRMALDDKVPATWLDWYNPASPPRLQPPAPRRAGAAKPAGAARAYIPPFPTLDELARWGRVKLVHTSPRRSAAGLEALYLMAYDHVLPPGERPAALREEIKAAFSREGKEGMVVRGDRAVADFTRAFHERRGDLQRWLERCEAGLGPAPSSARLLTDDMFNVGPSRYDAVVTYEHLVFPLLARVNDHADRMAELRVFYPQPTLLNEHPVVVLDADGGVTEAQRGAAARWLAFLRSREMQALAVVHGFRPAIPELSIRELGADENPFLSFRRYGIDIESPLCEPPRVGGGVVQDLIRLWEDATGRN
jgi:Bacterial extracellular solute-binding protein